MAERCYSINPRIKVNLVDDYLSSDNVKEILAMAPDLVLDCIDDVKAKLALMLHCRFNKIPLIVSGGAGGKLDPLKIRVADLSKTEQDPMLAKLRTQLRSKGICKSQKRNSGLPVFIQLIIRFPIAKFVLVQGCAVEDMVLLWW